MPTLYLVRHGQAAASWDQDPDPGLNDLGRQQAKDMAQRLQPLGPMPLLTSPLRRTRETAEPLARAWGVAAVVEPAVREIPSPSVDLAERRQWLQGVMAGTWAEADDWLTPWRQGVTDTLLAQSDDTVVVSHFVAINVAVGAAQGDDRATVFRPGHCAVTVLESDGGRLRLVELGEAFETDVL